MSWYFPMGPNFWPLTKKSLFLRLRERNRLQFFCNITTKMSKIKREDEKLYTYEINSFVTNRTIA